MAKVATQLIVFHDRITEGLEGVLDDVADAGYDGVETGILTEQIGAHALRLHLESRGLGLAGCHTGFDDLAQASSAIDYALDAGAKYLICSGVGDRKNGAEAYEAAADVFNKVGEVARERGAVFCYHNHSWEFEQFDGRTGLDIVYKGTDPDLVKLCIDTFWVADGGQNPPVFLHRHRKRIALAHLKDGKPGQRQQDGKPTFLELGSGELDFPAILSMLELARLEWITVEQDRSTLPPAESARRSRNYLREIGY